MSTDGAYACWELPDGSTLSVRFNYGSKEIVDNLEAATLSKVIVVIDN